MPDIGRDPTGGSSATALVNAVANSATGRRVVTLSLTTSGTPSAYAWLVNGSTTGLSSSTAASPTFTEPGADTDTATCTVTIGGEPVIATPESWLVGDGLSRVRVANGAARITYS